MKVESTGRGISRATVGRLPGYLHALTALADQGRAVVSSEDLATLTGVGSAQVRKDLSHLGTHGVRGVGYDVAALVEQMAGELGLSDGWPVVIVGMGNLGRALASYGGLADRDVRVVALADIDPAVVGTEIAGLQVQRLADIDTTVTPLGAGIIAVPADAAQSVADQLVGMGVRSLLSFAPGVLSVPADVDVRAVDLATELQILAFHHRHRVAEEVAP